jgi:hypothetical protein
MNTKTKKIGEAKYQELKKRLGLEENDEELKMGCHYWAEWQRCLEDEIEIIRVDDKGVERLNPEARWMNDCFRIWNEVAKKYGLTPYDSDKLKHGDKPASKKKTSGPPLRRIINQ